MGSSSGASSSWWLSAACALDVPLGILLCVFVYIKPKRGLKILFFFFYEGSKGSLGASS